MHLERVADRTEELAATVGLLETLLALARLEDALAGLDAVADEEVIDLRETRTVVDRAAPVVAHAEGRIAHMTSSLEGN